MVHVVNIIDPKGGVIPPIIILTISITPNCIGSIPTFRAAGTKSGARITRAAHPSRNIPTKSKSKLTIKSNIYLLSVKPTKRFVII